MNEQKGNHFPVAIIIYTITVSAVYHIYGEWEKICQFWNSKWSFQSTRNLLRQWRVKMHEDGLLLCAVLTHICLFILAGRPLGLDWTLGCFHFFVLKWCFFILVLCEPARLVWVLQTHFLSFFIYCCCLTSRTWLPFGCFELLIGVYRCSCAVFSPDLAHALGWALQLISLSLFIHCLDQDTKSNIRIHCVKILSVCYCREQLLTFNVDDPENVEL